ncbi:unnamed protein product [Durusdinium trenchii]|uniref:Uncharacterized protein n=1 Tax=Durusdinium trenchii TaxID=1381693 RepID=A0ABP0N162_9DINO
MAAPVGPSYSLASIDLSRAWVDLVKKDHVVATTRLKPDADITVRYGVRLSHQGGSIVFEDFVEEVDQSGSTEVAESELVKNIKETLSRCRDAEGSSLKFRVKGPFACQLQLVRTMRPAPAFGPSERCSSRPPPYDSSTDSFVTGPLRLELRPLLGRVKLAGMTNDWDIYHNMSPADVRGHFLLLPSLSERSNWRSQAFERSDCSDMVLLSSSIEPPGSLVLGFNSIGAGASQNHIHCHASPPPAGDQALTESWVYPVAQASSIASVNFKDSVTLSWLEYPVFSLRLSLKAGSSDVMLLGHVLHAVLEVLAEAPYNIGFLNQPAPMAPASPEVFVFARAQERATTVPSLKMGVSEMMGVFHAQSHEELDRFTAPGGENPMAVALREVSIEHPETLWRSIKDKLTLELTPEFTLRS